MSARQKLEQKIRDPAIRWPHQHHAAEARLIEHRFLLAEGQKSLVPVVVAHAGWADTAERQSALREMQHGIVDRHAAGNRAFEDALGARGIVVEVIERERTRASVDVVNRGIDGIDRDQGQDRAKDLVLHHREIFRWIHNEGRREHTPRSVAWSQHVECPRNQLLISHNLKIGGFEELG